VIDTFSILSIKLIGKNMWGGGGRWGRRKKRRNEVLDNSGTTFGSAFLAVLNLL
jgi:hypothetical protein